MSQSALSSAFTKTPYNPNLQKTPPVAEQSTSVAPQTAAPTDLVREPESVQNTAVRTEPAAPQPAVSSMVPPVAPTPPSPQQSPVDYAMLLQQMAAERQQLLAQNEQLKTAVDNLSKDSTELAKLRREHEMQQAIAAQSFDNLGSVDPEDAQAISRAVLTAAQAPIDSLRSELEQQRQALDKARQATEFELREMRRKALNAEIYKAHPDYDQLRQTKEYRDFMSQRDGMSSMTRDERAAEEYLRGNTAYVIDLLNQMKHTVPSVQQIYTVAPVQSASSPAAPTAAPDEPRVTLAELNSLYQMRRITPETYREELKKFRAAQ